MTREDRKVAIYATPGFKATWRKFLKICERDNMSASRLVRVWVEGYVARKDPGNPQRPITAYVEGHDDELTARRSDMIKELIKHAENRGGELSYSHVARAIREASSPAGYMIPVLARSMCKDLEKLGVTILWPSRGTY